MKPRFDEVQMETCPVARGAIVALLLTALCALVFAMPQTSWASTSTSKYFYNQLPEVEKPICDALATVPDSGVVELPGFDGYSEEDIQHAVNRCHAALLADDPLVRLKWERTATCQRDQATNHWKACLRRSLATDYEIRKTEAIVDQLAAAIGSTGNSFERVWKAATVVSSEVEYEGLLGASSDKTYMLRDSAMCCLTGIGICAGFSDLFKAVCEKAGIPCVSIGNAAHAWNMVQLDDGNWYHVDTSAGVPATKKRFMGDQSWDFATSYDLYKKSEPYLWSRESESFVWPNADHDSYGDGSFEPAGYTLPALDFTEPAATFLSETNEDGTTCTVTGFEGAQSGRLAIPSAIDGRTVTAVGPSAFETCKGFSSLEMPSTVKQIGARAFCWLTELRGTLALPEGLESVGEGAFGGCSGFTGSLVLPAGLKVLKQEAFAKCSGFSGNIWLPNDLSVGPDASPIALALTAPSASEPIRRCLATRSPGLL